MSEVAPAPSTARPRAAVGEPTGRRDARIDDASDDGSDGGLVAAGATLFAIGWATGIVWGSVDLATTRGSSSTETFPAGTLTSQVDSTCSDQVGGWLFLPIVGPVVSLAAAFDCTTRDYRVDQTRGTIEATPRSYGDQGLAIASFVVTELLELVGLSVLLPGLVGHSPQRHGDARGALELDRGVTLAILPSAPGANVGGLSLRLEL